MKGLRFFLIFLLIGTLAILSHDVFAAKGKRSLRILRVVPKVVKLEQTKKAKIIGKGFKSGLEVDLGEGISFEVKKVKSTKITGVISITFQAETDKRDVTIINPDGKSITKKKALRVKTNSNSPDDNDFSYKSPIPDGVLNPGWVKVNNETLTGNTFGLVPEGVHGGPTSKREIFINSKGESTAKTSSDATKYPKGTIVIKELFDSSDTLTSIVAMVKREKSYDSSNNNWEWFKLNPSDATIMKNNPDSFGKIAMCSGCHSSVRPSTSGKDFVFNQIKDNTITIKDFKF